MADGDMCDKFATETSQYCLEHTIQFQAPPRGRLVSSSSSSSASTSANESLFKCSLNEFVHRCDLK